MPESHRWTKLCHRFVNIVIDVSIQEVKITLTPQTISNLNEVGDIDTTSNTPHPLNYPLKHIF